MHKNSGFLQQLKKEKKLRNHERKSGSDRIMHCVEQSWLGVWCARRGLKAVGKLPQSKIGGWDGDRCKLNSDRCKLN